jgi:hypothetical protein
MFALKRKFTLFFSSLLFVVILIYVFSSWWIWTYSVPFGQRVMIDFYCFFIMLFAIFLKEMKDNMIYLFLGLSVFFVGFNLWRTYQYHKGILPWEYVTKDLYFSSIINTHPVARYLVNEARIESNTKINLHLLNEENAEEYGANAFSNGHLVFKSNLSVPTKMGIQHLRISFFAQCNKSSSQIKFDFVLYRNGKIIRTESRYPEEYLEPGNKAKLSFGFELDKSELPDYIELRAFYPESVVNLFFENGTLELITEVSEPEFVP